jgi:hypothetical protein
MTDNYLNGGYGYGHAKQALFELILVRFLLAFLKTWITKLTLSSRSQIFPNSEYLASMQMHVEAGEKMPLLRIELPEPRMLPSQLGSEVLCLVSDLFEPIARVLELVQCRYVG